MTYSFERETYEYLLKDILGYKDLGPLGGGSQSPVVWRGSKDNNEVAIKVSLGETETVKAEKDLKSHMPEYLKSKIKVSDIFNDKSAKGIDNYYKYMIVYNSTAMDDEDTFVKFKNKGWKLTVYDIYGFIKEKLNSNEKSSELKTIHSFVKEGSAQRGFFWRCCNSKVQQRGANALLNLFENLGNQKIYVLTGAIADDDLAKYIQDRQRDNKLPENLTHVLLEVRKLAKHILKGLIALHKSNRAAYDIHPGNVVVTNVTKPDGTTHRIKYQLIDFGSSKVLSDGNPETLVKEDLYRLGYALLIPTFWALSGKKLEQVPQENNYSTLDRIRDKLSTAGKLGDNFVGFLKKLRDKQFVSASSALSDDFFKVS